jgi:putative Mg2+ transporter-C (MgtC) family protein
MEFADTALRLLAATLIGGAIGLNRDLHGKPIGVRTLSLVALASAIAVLTAVSATASAQGAGDAASRVIQGVLTGIGFLGASAITRDLDKQKIHGLTTAACTWLTACVGLACGLAAWPILIAGLLLTSAILFCGGPIEKYIHHRLGRDGEETDSSDINS